MRVDKSSIISVGAKIGKNVLIGPFCVIGNCTIGDNCIIHSHAVLSDNVHIGDNVEIFPGAIIGKIPKGAGATARIPEFEEYVRIGKDCSVGPHAIIYYDVEIGNNTLLGDGASIREQCRIGSYCIISRYVTINYNTSIGDRTKIMDNSHITGNAIIGESVFISTLVGTTNDNKIRSGYDEHIVGPTIKNNAVIGVGASLLPGVQIGKDSTVAAGSVVTKDVKENTLVIGIPAKPK